MFGFYENYFVLFGINISYYGFFIAVGIGLGIFIACKNAKLRNLKSEDILVACCYILPLAVLGARGYYVLFDGQPLSSFWEFFDVTTGIAIYGAVIGGAAGIALYCLIHKKNFFDVADVAVPSLILGQSIGRNGCFFAGCCYGWDVGVDIFPLTTFVKGGYRLSTFFYESWWDALGFVLLMLLLYKVKWKQRGAIAGTYLIFYGVGRAIIETFRGDSLMMGTLKTSQILSIILVVAGVALILFYHFKDKKISKKE